MLKFLKLLKQKIIYFFIDSKKVYFHIMFVIITIATLTMFAGFIILGVSQYNESTFLNINSEDTKDNIEVSCDNSGVITIEFDKKNMIKKSDLKFLDDYLNLRYKIIFPKSYKSKFKEKIYQIKNEFIKTIEIKSNEKDEIEFIINETAIFGYEITEDENGIYIEPKNPKDIYDKIVVIDPGHGGSDPGTNVPGLQEKDINLDICRKIVTLLDQNPNIKVYTTRTSDVYIDLHDRAVFGNNLADLFVSVHVNANDRILSANGTEVYFYPHENDNEFNITSQECAEIMCDNISLVTNSKRRENKEYDYLVIRESKIPSILCEVGFITNNEEAKLLSDDAYRTKIANGIYNGIEAIFKKYIPIR